MKKLIIFLVFMLVFTACGTDNSEPPIEKAVEPAEESASVKTELTVWGMNCISCENKIISALSEIDGVIEVSADSSADKVTVTHEPELDVSVIEKAITEEGFNIP